MSQDKKQVVAAFDFDGTLTRHDSLLPFLWRLFDVRNFLLKLLRSSWFLALYALRLLSNNVAKEKLLLVFLNGMEQNKLEDAGKRFAAQYLPGIVRSDAERRLRWHQSRGDYCVVISASMDIYVKPWAEAMGFDAVICSTLEMHDKHATGKLTGGNCYGPEKAERLKNLLGLADYTLYAYGDSRGDKELLAMADYGYYRKMPGTN